MEKINSTLSKYTYIVNSNRAIDEDIYTVVAIYQVGDMVYFEIIAREYFDAFIKEQKELNQHTIPSQEDEEAELKEACETILKTDPFGNKYAGKTLIEIYRENFLWVDKALKEMKNKFIVDKLLIIQKAVKNGKINI